jgi:hypothetical protein
LSLNISTGISEHFNGASQVAINDSYFEALQTLSPSRWILYETRTLDKPDDFSDLKEMYRSLLKGIAWKDVRAKGGSIQVTGPAGYGKSALVKLISQEMPGIPSVFALHYRPRSPLPFPPHFFPPFSLIPGHYHPFHLTFFS